MRKLAIWIAALMVVGCGQNSGSEDIPVSGKIFTASIVDEVSRVYMGDDFALHYNAADEISIFSTTDNCKYTFSGKDGDTTGEFTTEQIPTGTALGRTYALYPYDTAATVTADGVISATLISEQGYIANSVGRGANMMVAATASAEDSHLGFRNVCGYVCVNLYGKGVTLKSLILKANDGEKIAGKLSITAANGALPVATPAVDAVGSIVLNLGEGVTLSESATEPTRFIFAVVPTTLSKGFSVVAHDATGETFVQSIDRSISIERNVVSYTEAVEVVFEEPTIEGLTAPESIELPKQSLYPKTVTIGSTSEAVTITASEPWFGVVESTKHVEMGKAATIKLWLEPNLSTSARSAVVTVTGQTTGARVDIPVTQPAYFTTIKESFPARLELQSGSCDTSKWGNSGIVKPKNSDAMLTVVSTSGNLLSCVVSSGASVANLGVGDYLLYAIPTKGVAAGEQIDFMCTLGPKDSKTPKYYIFEYWDDGQWKTVESSLRTAEDYPDLKYSLICRVMDESYNVTFTQSFTLTKPVTDGCVKVRLRVLTPGTGSIRVPSGNGYMGMYMISYPNAVPVVDSKKMLFIGNSFTYYYGTAFMFKEIARTQGHQVDAVIGVKGSQSFAEHIKLYMSLDAIKQGGYDVAFLQDTSPNQAGYAANGTKSILDACNKINKLTLDASPTCQIVYERTWAVSYENYRGYGSYDKLDYLTKKGLEMLVRDVDHKGIIVSPIGLGFREARLQGINLLFTDNRHQSRSGAYMKACINYLTIYKTRFTENVSNCGVDATLAKSIRDIAERVVFEGVEENYDFE